MILDYLDDFEGGSDFDSMLDDVSIGDGVGASLDVVQSKPGKDIFAEEHRKAWDKSVEARCDFTRKVKLVKRSDNYFIASWQKSIVGRTLTDIKGDDKMIDFFAIEAAGLLKEVLGDNLRKGDWCICTSPKRRHKERNFATLISIKIASMIDIPFYEDVAFCHSRQRLGAVFSLNVLPQEPNVIVYDDFVTTGQTLAAMKNLLTQYGKNVFLSTGINNAI